MGVYMVGPLDKVKPSWTYKTWRGCSRRLDWFARHTNETWISVWVEDGERMQEYVVHMQRHPERGQWRWECWECAEGLPMHPNLSTCASSISSREMHHSHPWSLVAYQREKERNPDL